MVGQTSACVAMVMYVEDWRMIALKALRLGYARIWGQCRHARQRRDRLKRPFSQSDSRAEGWDEDDRACHDHLRREWCRDGVACNLISPSSDSWTQSQNWAHYAGWEGQEAFYNQKTLSLGVAPPCRIPHVCHICRWCDRGWTWFIRVAVLVSNSL